MNEAPHFAGFVMFEPFRIVIDFAGRLRDRYGNCRVSLRVADARARLSARAQTGGVGC